MIGDWAAGVSQWLLVSDAGWWVAFLLIGFGTVALAGCLVWRYGDVRMGPDPVHPTVQISDATTVIVTELRAAPNYSRQDTYQPTGQILRTIDAISDTTDAVTEIINMRTNGRVPAYQPLGVADEPLDPGSPIFNSVRPPASRWSDEDTHTLREITF